MGWEVINYTMWRDWQAWIQLVTSRKGKTHLSIFCQTNTQTGGAPLYSTHVTLFRFRLTLCKYTSNILQKKNKKHTHIQSSRPSRSVLPLKPGLSLSPRRIWLARVAARSHKSHHPRRVPTTVWPISITELPSNVRVCVCSPPCPHSLCITSTQCANFSE